MALEKNIKLKSVDVKYIYEWPFIARLFVYFVVSVAVFCGGYFFDFSSQGDQIYSRFKQEHDLKQQVQTILKNEQKMAGEVSQYPDLLKVLDHWQEQFINSNNLPDLLNQILKIGATNHIQFSIFSPGAKKTQDDYYVVPIKVVMQGSYSQLGNFISQVANMPLLVSIGDFVILKKGDQSTGQKSVSEDTAEPDRLTCMLTLEVYNLANKK